MCCWALCSRRLDLERFGLERYGVSDTMGLASRSDLPRDSQHIALSDMGRLVHHRPNARSLYELASPSGGKARHEGRMRIMSLVGQTEEATGPVRGFKIPPGQTPDEQRRLRRQRSFRYEPRGADLEWPKTHGKTTAEKGQERRKGSGERKRRPLQRRMKKSQRRPRARQG